MRKSDENLRPVRTTEEAKERGRKGGIKSGEARRKKRTMKNAAKLLLDMPITQDNVIKNVRKFGIDEEDSTNQMAILIRMTLEAMSGNVRAAEFLRSVIGDDAAGQDRAERLKLEKERHELEKRKAEADSGDDDDSGLPIIINVRPDRKDDDF